MHASASALMRRGVNVNTQGRQGRQRVRRCARAAGTALIVGAVGAMLASVTVPAPASAQEAAPVPPAGVALTASDANAWLDGYFPYALKSDDIAGAVVAIVKDGEILTERGYGFSDVAKRTPVDPKLTLFRPGSVSKLLTWTAVMQLVEQGKIDLDADVNRYLDFKLPERAGKPITMRNLMQHTAGFEEHAKGIISAKNDLPSFDMLLKSGIPERIFAAGSTPAYSNYGASLAGYIVQRISHEPFDEYIERHILAPLGMEHSSFRQPLPPALAPLMSKGYAVASGEAHPFEFIGPAPAGALSSTADDMARFMIAHLQDGEYHGQRILSAATAQMMHDSAVTFLPPLNRMELGFFETNINGREVIGHLGDTDWFHTSLHLFLKEHVGLYVSFNSMGKDEAVQGLRWALFQDFADRYFPAAVPAPVVAQVDARTARRDATLMSGTWVNSRSVQSNFLAVLNLLGDAKVGVNGKGDLQLPFTGLNGKPRHWVEVARFVWQDTGSHDRAAAKLADGRPVRFSFDEFSPFIVFDRAPWYANSAWLLPLTIAGFAALLLTALFWPVTAIVRRSYGARLILDGPSLRAYRLSKIAAVAMVLGLSLWGLILAMILQDTGALGGRLDPLLWLAQIFGLVGFWGGLALILWNLIVVWRGKRRWPARLWSIVLTVSAVGIVWVAWVFKLFHLGTSY